MHKFEYDIRLNDLGAPYVHLPKKMENKTEDKFMWLEMSRMVLINILSSIKEKRKKGKKTLSDEDVQKIVSAFNTLTSLADEVGILLKAQKEIEDQLSDLLNIDEDE
jgi:type I restriction-modification system DNA methylase subunit